MDQDPGNGDEGPTGADTGTVGKGYVGLSHSLS